MGHETARFCAEVYYFFRQKVRFYRRNPVTLYAVHFVEPLYKHFEVFTAFASEITDVHAGYDYFFSALSGNFFCLRYYGIRRRTATEPACIGNGAICTEIIAAVLHFQKISCPVAARTRGNKSLDVAHCAAFLLAFAGNAFGDIFQYLSFVFHAHHEVHAFYFGNFLRLKLHIASHDNHKSLRIVLNKLVNNLTTFVIGHFGNRTCVYKTDVRVAVVRCLHAYTA